MQTVSKIGKINLQQKRVSVPETLKPKSFTYITDESVDFKNFISSQHPLINVWLVFSFVSIGILSVILYLI